MNHSIYKIKLKTALKQRNCLLVGFIILGLAIVFQSLTLWQLSAKRERIVILPPDVSQEFWVDHDSVSTTYLKIMSDYYISLALNVTPASVDEQTRRLLAVTHSLGFADLDGDLAAKAIEVKRSQITTFFTPINSTVDAEAWEVTIEGDLIRILGQQSFPTVRKTYVIGFLYDNGRMWLKSIIEVLDEAN